MCEKGYDSSSGTAHKYLDWCFLDSKKSKNDEEPISISDEEVESG